MRLNLISAAVLSLAGLCTSAALATPSALATTPGAAPALRATTQLPRNVRPTHYAVSITPDAKASTFAGHVAIDIEVLQPSASITLNATDLAFGKVQLSAGAGPSRTGTAKVDAQNQTATFRFGRTIAKGSYTLTLDYTGKIGTQAVGLFSLDYENNGVKKRALYTQFENSDARRLIPSWDEPNYKASFALEATVPGDQMAVSNMPVASATALADGRSRVQFGVTPKMSTYLLFFALGEFDRATANVDGTELGVITQKGALPQAAFALESAKAVLKEYNDYFGIPYPLPKLDNIAAPGSSQFFGAMENWGAIFTFEYAMLLDPAISTQRDKENAFSTAAHEMAHQWFGDLVTMGWWDDLWLNEGFASWMESRTTARLHPEWKTAINAVRLREYAMGEDSLATSHPVVQHVSTVEQASQAFDAITYQKGEAVIRMLENYVGDAAWREGVRAYFQRHAYGNTTTDDLWSQVEAAAHKPITRIAHDFTRQPGVPLIRVDRVVCEAGQSVISLSQGQFSRDQPNKKSLVWNVPVIAQVVGNKDSARALVSGGRASLSAPGCGTVLVNAGQSGYYRTLYAPDAFTQVTGSFSGLEPIDQVGILADTWALSMAGRQPMTDLLDLVHTAPADAAPQVWAAVADDLASLHRYYRGEAERQQRFARYATARLAPVLQRLGWVAAPDEAEPVAKLRDKLISTLSELDDPGVIAEARRRYAAKDTDPGALPAPLRKTITAVVARHADDATWDALRTSAQAEKSAMIKSYLYELLATTKDQALAQRALVLALTDEPALTDSANMVAIAAEEHPELAFDFAMRHMQQVNTRVDATSRSRYFPRLADGSRDPAMIGKVKAYAAAHLSKESRRDADAAIASIRYRIAVHQERLPQVDSWLQRHTP